MEAVVDQSRVIHHLTLSRFETGAYLYAWASGTSAFEFPEGGLRIGPGANLHVQIHYNNEGGTEAVTDSSGVALYLATPVGTEYRLANPTVREIAVPPQSRAAVAAECTSRRRFRILASLPHMHEIGDSLAYDVVRATGETESVIALDEWSFDSQYFYDTPVTVNAGDTLRLSCSYANPRDTTVIGGPLTTQEMCFNFTYVTPPEGAANEECSPQLLGAIDGMVDAAEPDSLGGPL